MIGLFLFLLILAVSVFALWHYFKQRAEQREQLTGEINARAQESYRSTSDFVAPCPANLEYLPFQRAGIEYAFKRPGSIIADDMGLGKTIEAIGVINCLPDTTKVIIVCPLSLKINWRNELDKWLVNRSLKITILTSKTTEIGAILAAHNIFIVHYDILRKFASELLSTRYDICILDEAHFIKNTDAQRSVVAHRLSAASAKSILLTGTPILNCSTEVVSLMVAAKLDADPINQAFISKANELKSLSFSYPYEDYMKNILRTTVMIRRKKEDVLPQLPKKTRQIIEIEPDSSLKACMAHELAFIEQHPDLQSLLDSVAEQSPTDLDTKYRKHVSQLSDKSASFAEISALRHATAMRKVPHVCSYITELLAHVDSIVVYAHHKDVVASILSKLGSIAVPYTGEQNTEERNDAVVRFQSGAVRVFVGSIRAAAFGITLTRSSTVVFAELDWTPAINTQAEDRCHRIGQRECVNVFHVVLNNSLDARIAKIIVSKQSHIDKIME